MEASQIKILIVDDEVELLKNISEVFTLFGFTVKTASGGTEAWQMLQAENYDLVISDVRMPNGDGIELLSKCKERNPYSPKVLLISGFNDHKHEELLDFGVDGFFTKPFDATAVRNAIKETLLDIKALWGSNKEISAQKTLTIKISNLESSHNVQFGRRGVFIRMNIDFPKVGQIIKFIIDIEDVKPVSQIIGWGSVMWVRERAQVEKEPGVGVLIQQIDNEALNPFVDWILGKKFISLIPLGTKKANENENGIN
ncbi:MAG: response regulator [Bdellovibrionales bacterium]|nr:response regulator [Bdellovibrionales bacterium]